jgi:predicted MFS family arabinose efflux permease
MVGNGLAFGVWPAHISAFKQIYGLSNAQLTLLLFTLTLGAVLTTRVVGRALHLFDSSGVAWKGQICYALALSVLPWTKSLPWRKPGGVRAAIAATSIGYLGFSDWAPGGRIRFRMAWLTGSVGDGCGRRCGYPSLRANFMDPSP